MAKTPIKKAVKKAAKKVTLKKVKSFSEVTTEDAALKAAKDYLLEMEKVVNTNNPFLRGDFINRQKVQQQKAKILQMKQSMKKNAK